MTEQTFEFDVIKVNYQGEIIERTRQQNTCFQEDLGEGVILEMVFIPGGTFLMGSPNSESEDVTEKPQNELTVAPFYLGKYPVTQAQWHAVASLPKVKFDINPEPSKFKGANKPVDSISYVDALEFYFRLTEKTGKPYRLPTEAEWEYACRAGTTTPFHFGETITTEIANYDGDFTYSKEPKGVFRGETTEVGYFQVANAFGLYDMHGNIGEWCDSRYLPYKGGPQEIGDRAGYWLDFRNDRVLRGGTWTGSARGCRSATRFCCDMERRSSSVGMRVACSRQ
ncbi:formylglycine-generating enzyme family protein [Microseira wollei]|uniref:Serine/threonine protein kinase n=1 Tax=Microseira wollei NIES-4236 TaxID=2530354 RepID=A0AAV3WML8_9CYAN|nr:formylglycine-generating enzyme family protein [Microseira wollei]GET42714.1 serine/threonine protein kinase [Microseira wollei NIES-4236]